jgi:hypothetical protein
MADMFFWLFPMVALTEQCIMCMDRFFPKKSMR